jgi:hypothetical protein
VDIGAISSAPLARRRCKFRKQRFALHAQMVR